MQDERLLILLERLAEQLEIPVRYAAVSTDEIAGEGGSCLLRGDRQIILDRGLSVKRRVRLLAAGLAQLDLDGVFLLPAVREAIEAARRDGRTPGTRITAPVAWPRPPRSGGRENRSGWARGRISGRLPR